MYLTLPSEFSTLNANSKLTVKPQPAATPKPTATSKYCQTYHGLGGIGAWNTIARCWGYAAQTKALTFQGGFPSTFKISA